ncbi:non-canonical purine NTP pyrophosphatase [Candidatus Peregrinibacteria bacterium]|jgi:XTP/dITP diphosphohydrolase|nr:non-canonical purine NTP pyrophosphatase [Candidatus Peregrinibacteria bacterium]MBT7483182.1 non-canonical purine NTP pyrophosphatase [Candidatus Peregrinibacteria bacterium]MBT7703209.1 non-canonical purine NTP pyrophosphatase [Candidatus Peregrinibacteria bacterium]
MTSILVLMKNFLIATGNIGKFGEIAAVLQDLPYELKSLQDLFQKSQVEENGETHDENAFLKARHFFKETNWMTMGEDSGLEVDVLKGELGLHTRRFGAGEEASDEEWLEVFLKRMEEFSENKRAARFVCSAALILEDGSEYLFHGTAEGIITLKPEATILPGLPLSSVFKPNGFDKVYAGLSKEEKAQISHRGLAIGKVKKFLLER